MHQLHSNIYKLSRWVAEPCYISKQDLPHQRFLYSTQIAPTLNKWLSLQTSLHVCTDWLKMCRHSNIAHLWKLFLYISWRILKVSFWNYVSSLLSTHFTPFYLYRSSRFSQSLEP